MRAYYFELQKKLYLYYNTIVQVFYVYYIITYVFKNQNGQRIENMSGARFSQLNHQFSWFLTNRSCILFLVKSVQLSGIVQFLKTMILPRVVQWVKDPTKPPESDRLEAQRVDLKPMVGWIRVPL